MMKTLPGQQEPMWPKVEYLFIMFIDRIKITPFWNMVRVKGAGCRIEWYPAES